MIVSWYIYGEKNYIGPNSETLRQLDLMILNQIQKDFLSKIDLD